MGWIRLDSTSGNIYMYTGNNDCVYSPGEELVDSLKSSLNDVTDFCGFVKRKCNEISTVNLFGSYYNQKSFQDVNSLSPVVRKFAEGIGPYYFIDGHPSPTYYNLRGAYIDGQYYGDTVLTSIINTGSQPESYSLSQNYPNPFNPVTKIVYTIPSSQFVMLKVYEQKGELVEILQNGSASGGTHELNFNASGLASGIYFYKIETDLFTETRRMVLLK